jgi:hypothetical protein
MTLTSTTVKNTHTGDGTTVAFSYGFKVFSETEIAVYVAGVLQTLTTHYTLSGVGTSTGGNVTFETGAKPASSASIVFVRVPARTQTTDYTITGTIDPQTVEDALDKATMLVQDVGDSADNAFGFANTVTDAGTIKVSLGASARASKLLSFDASGNLVATQEIGTNKGNWAASTAYVARDIIKDTGTNNIFLCNTAHTSSGSLPITTNTDSAKWDLLVDAASATTSQTAAATSASAASTSATAAATSATASASSATSSASSATSSASSATSSASSATSSASSSTTSGNYSNKVDGAVTGTEFSSKAWALGGTGVTDIASRGAAKEWATAAEDDLVDGSEYSAKHYSLKAQTHATNAAANSGPYYSATTGTNTYVATPTPALAAYAEGVDIILKFGTSNTGTTTLNVSSLGAKDLKKADGSVFSSGELTSGQIQHFVYNGTEFRLLGTVAATEDLIKINTLDIFQNTINDMADHSDNLLETVDGFTDNFQDGSTQDNTAFNLTGSSGVTHDNTNKLWGNTDGSTGSNDDKPYTTEGNYIQQFWDEVIVGGNAVFTNGSATVTTSGTFPTNCANGRISQDGTNWYDISSRDSATQLTLSVVFAQSTVTGTFDIRMTEFDSGVVKLNVAGAITTLVEDIPSTTTSANAKGSLTNDFSQSAQFKATATTAISQAILSLKTQGSPTGTMTVKIQSSTTPTASGGSPSSTLATSATVDTSVLTSSYAEVTFYVSYTPTLNNFYFITLERSVSDTSNYIVVGCHTGTGGYAFAHGMGYQNSAYFSNAEPYFKVNTGSIGNPITEYVSAADSYAQSTDVSAWLDINSSTVTETLNSQNAYYWVIFSAASAYGVDTQVSVFNQTGSVWRTIAKNSAGIWQYNNNASHDATQTLVNSTVNDMLHAVSQAISTQAANRMTGTEAGAISDAEWAATNGFATSDTLLSRGLTLVSSSASQNPEVSLFRVNYDSDKADGTFLTRAFGGTNMPPAPSGNIDTMVALIIDKRTTGTPVYEASSNAGTTWTAFSTWVHEEVMSNGYTKRMAEIDVSAHTGSRTSPLIRITNGSTGEDYDLKAIGIKYK